MTESVQQNDMDRYQDTIFDGAKEMDDECFHTPDDMIEYLGMDEDNNGITKHFKCRCGKNVIEEYGFREIKDF